MQPYVGHIFISENIGYEMYVAWCTGGFISHYSLFQNISSLIQLYDKLKLVFEMSFIGEVNPLYAPLFPLILLLDKYKSV